LARGPDLELSIADDGVGVNARSDPRSTGMGQRIVSAMAAKLSAIVERDPAHSGTRVVVRFPRASSKPAAKTATEPAG
jgi:two-component sensor histidine kinase